MLFRFAPLAHSGTHTHKQDVQSRAAELSDAYHHSVSECVCVLARIEKTRAQLRGELSAVLRTCTHTHKPSTAKTVRCQWHLWRCAARPAIGAMERTHARPYNKCVRSVFDCGWRTNARVQFINTLLRTLIDVCSHLARGDEGGGVMASARPDQIQRTFLRLHQTRITHGLQTHIRCSSFWCFVCERMQCVSPKTFDPITPSD